MISQSKFDVILACQSEYVTPRVLDGYHRNIRLEQNILLEALRKKGMTCQLVGWDSDFDWSSTHIVLIRETWDYYVRIEEFKKWLDGIKNQTRLINDVYTLTWNLDKFYLMDLRNSGINIPLTVFLEKGDNRSLNDLHVQTGWQEMIIKPAVAGAARDTYRIGFDQIKEFEETFQRLLKNERMLFQQFQPDVVESGERTLVLIDGVYTHCVLKRAKKGDFRVQDDHGGTVHEYTATSEEIRFARKVIEQIKPTPAYARVDIITDVNRELALQELELIEPELWFRHCNEAAEGLAKKLAEYVDISD